jgi:hypothetical protein
MSEPIQEERVERERLVALAKLGLAVGIVYTVPGIVAIPRAYAAHCSGHPGGGHGGGGVGGGGGNPPPLQLKRFQRVRNLSRPQ